MTKAKKGRQYTKTHKTVRDLEAIYRFGRREWGREKSTQYLLHLEKCFERLAAMPESGPFRPEIGPGIRSFVHRAHVIYYRAERDLVEIVRVLHTAQDQKAQFS